MQEAHLSAEANVHSQGTQGACHTTEGSQSLFHLFSNNLFFYFTWLRGSAHDLFVFIFFGLLLEVRGNKWWEDQ